MDSDGTFLEERGTGEYEVSQYDCKNATAATATFRLKFVEDRQRGGFSKVLAYATFDETYERIIEDGDSDKHLVVVCSRNVTIRTLKFDATVRQVQSCRHHLHLQQVRKSEDKINKYKMVSFLFLRTQSTFYCGMEKY